MKLLLQHVLVRYSSTLWCRGLLCNSILTLDLIAQQNGSSLPTNKSQMLSIAKLQQMVGRAKQQGSNSS